jgi:transposase
MEGTGIYWKLVWHILDDSEFELVLANAAHVKNVRKTDVNDAMWLAELLAHGLIWASFVPNAQTQEMRRFVSSRATCCGCKRHSRTPTSKWIRCLPT